MTFPVAVVAFAAATVVIAIAGTALARRADVLADVTGLGEAMFGGVLLGAATSLPGIVASVTAAFEGRPDLAIANAVGGILAQTAFLALADLVYPKANLEHAAPSVVNLMHGALLIALLAFALAAPSLPDVTLAGVHPVSVLLIVAYVAGVRLARKASDEPAWRPRWTDATQIDVPAEENLARKDVGRLWAVFVLLALVVAGCGFLVAESAIVIADATGLEDSVVGMLFTAISTSLPELVTCVAAVRRGAPTLAVADILGGNTFDVLFLACADVAFRSGSLYAAFSSQHAFLLAAAIGMTAVLLLGMLRRERRGFANIGFESALVLLLYAASTWVLVAG